MVIAAVALATTSGGAAKNKTNIELTSPELKDGAELPKSATCDGEGKSPALAWKTTSDVMSQALIVDDPDAPKGSYVHWTLFDIPKGTMSIPHGGSAGVVGTNSADKKAFAPACPPSGSGVHHYRFHLYALDVDKVGAKAGASQTDLVNAMKGHIIGESTLTGTYEKR
jgi:Raf kinase inhibitor-like YbhB/YbcL family protein